jgi:predicted ATPase
VSISGASGTGKTATLKELRRALTETGREALAVAPTMSAVEELFGAALSMLYQVIFKGSSSFRQVSQD